MMTPRPNHPSRSRATTSGMRSANTEWMMASLVLVAIALSILSSMAGFADAEGKEKNGVRRAASQLERKVVKMPALCGVLESGRDGTAKADTAQTLLPVSQLRS